LLDELRLHGPAHSRAELRAQQSLLVTKIVRSVVFLVVVFAGTSAWAGDGQTISAATHGLFVPAPYALASTVIRQAEKGNVKAEAQLGWMFATGRGVPQDFAKAAKWYYRAAIRGYGWAQFELGMLYNKGQGVPCDYVLSYMWLNLSASQAVGDDRDFKVRMRDAVASKLTPAEVAEAQHMALAWYKLR
jgi:uncharacterized protein